MEDYITFIFKRQKKLYIIKAECELDAWKILQREISWNISIIKKQFKLIYVSNTKRGNYSVIKIN